MAGIASQFDAERLERRVAGMARLITAIQDLSHARSIDDVTKIVRTAARELTGSDGATFVLRDADKCYYVDEDSIGPLWKGQRFPMAACISGWVMLNREPALIEDIYEDCRVPIDAYRPTFVKSLLMVPIRTAAPIGAIGNYWATPHCSTDDEVEFVQALANTTAVAIENVQLYEQLEQRVRTRTLQLEDAYRELETFSYSVSHDLKNPLSRIGGFAELLQLEAGSQLDERAKGYLSNIQQAVTDMASLMDDLLRLAKFTKAELHWETVDLTNIARHCIENLQGSDAQRQVTVMIEPNMVVDGDAGMLKIVVENLLSYAWKYTRKCSNVRIEFGQTSTADGWRVFFVRDNGAGFDSTQASRLFTPFERLRQDKDFAGHGVGLATVERVIHRHGGRIWAEGRVGEGATFSFTLSANPASVAATV